MDIFEAVEALQDALDEAGLASAGFTVTDGSGGAMVATIPPVLVWLSDEGLVPRADLGGSPEYASDADPDLEDWLDFDPGPDTIDFDDTCERAWLVGPPADFAHVAAEVVRLAAVATRALGPLARTPYFFEPPLPFAERVEQGPW